MGAVPSREASDSQVVGSAHPMARAARVVKDQLLPKLQQLYRGQPVPYQQVEEVEINNNFYQNNNYSNVNNNNLLELPAPSSPGLRRWQRWSRNVVGLNCLFLPTPRKYMAVPRTPVQTDRLDTTEASAVYRATRDNNNECDRQGKLHKSEKRATSSGGGCVASSSGDFGSSYRPFEQLVLPAWRNWNSHRLRPFPLVNLSDRFPGNLGGWLEPTGRLVPDAPLVVQPRNEAASSETWYKGSLPLRLTHWRADAGLQARHCHHGLRVHQGLDHRSQTWSLDPLDLQSWILYQALEILSPCIKDFYPHTDSLLSEKKQRIARNNKRNLDSVTPSPVFDPHVEMFCESKVLLFKIWERIVACCSLQTRPRWSTLIDFPCFVSMKRPVCSKLFLNFVYNINRVLSSDGKWGSCKKTSETLESKFWKRTWKLQQFLRDQKLPPDSGSSDACNMIHEIHLEKRRSTQNQHTLSF